MGRAPCCSKVGLHRGPWTAREDTLLANYIQTHGEGLWRSVPKKAGLLRCGKSCRLRWMNYLRPDIKRGNISSDEEDLIVRLHKLLGNRWSLIAGRLPGRTDNEIKNYWNSHLSKKLENPNRKIPCAHGSTTGSKNMRVGGTKPQRKKREKFEIHHPKPVRLMLGANNSTFGGSDTKRCGVGDVRLESLDTSWLDAKDAEVPVGESMLDKIYEEYSQLLKSRELQVGHERD